MEVKSSSIADGILETLTDTRDPYGRNRDRDGLSFELTGPWATRFFYLLTGILSLWMFVYVSGIFPYLGRIAHVNSFSGMFMSRDSSWGTFKVPRAYLFKGQTIFIDYKVLVEGEASVRIYLEGAPMYRLAFWPRTSFPVKGSGTGRLIYRVPENGFYNVEANAFQWKGKYRVDYVINWGAVWADGLHSLPPTDGPVQQMPAEPASDPFQALPPSLGS